MRLTNTAGRPLPVADGRVLAPSEQADLTVADHRTELDAGLLTRTPPPPADDTSDDTVQPDPSDPGGDTSEEHDS